MSEPGFALAIAIIAFVLVVVILLLPSGVVPTALTWRRAARLDARYRRELGGRYLLVRFEDLIAHG